MPWTSIGETFIGVSCLPWRWRTAEGVRSPLSYNVDFSRGTLRKRPGFRAFDVRSNIYTLGMSSLISSTGETLIVTIRYNTSTVTSTFRVVDMAGTTVYSRSLQDFPLAERPDPDNWYTFTQYGKKLYVASDKGRTMLYQHDKRDATLDGLRYATGIDATDIEDGAVVGYMKDFPSGGIIITHENRLVVAGFDGQDAHTSTVKIDPAGKTVIIGTALAVQDQFAFPPQAVVTSEVNRDDTFAMDRQLLVNGAEKVTGLASTSAGLLVLTDQSVYTAGISANEFGGLETGTGVFTAARIADGVSCVHQRSIAQGRGITAWMGSNGIYALQDGQVRLISADIEELWHPFGWQQTPMADKGRQYGALKGPWVMQLSRLDKVCGGFDEARQMFWWAVPIAGWDEFNSLVLVWYPEINAWTFWGTHHNDVPFEPMCLLSVSDRGKPRFFFAAYNKGVYEFGADFADLDTSSVRNDIEWYWQSPWVDFGPGDRQTAQALSVRHKTTGHNPSTLPKFYVESELSHGNDDAEPKTSGDMATTPENFNSTVSAPEYTWDNGNWNEFKWHSNEPWRAEYRGKAVNSSGVRVGVDSSDIGIKAFEVFSIDLQTEPKGDTLRR